MHDSFGPAKRRTRRLLLSVLAFLYVSQGSAQSEAPLRVLTEDLPTLNYMHDGRIVGYATELTSAALTAAGLSAQIELLPWSRALKLAETRANTVLYSVARTPDREPDFIWIANLGPRYIHIYALGKRTDLHINSAQDLLRYRLGVVQGMASTGLLREMLGSDSNFDVTTSQESNMKKLFLGRVDVIVALDWSAAHYAKAVGESPEQLRSVFLLDKRHELWVAMNRDSNPDLVEALRKGFDNVMATPLPNQLRAKYMDCRAC